MVRLELILDKYGEMGEKTGWTYVKIRTLIANQLKPNTKKSFRIKGFIDNLPFNQLALIPIGERDFILPINGTIRKQISKEAGDKVLLKIEEDDSEFEFSADFLACIGDDPQANEFFKTLSPWHQRYFSKWIESTKPLKLKLSVLLRHFMGYHTKWIMEP